MRVGHPCVLPALLILGACTGASGRDGEGIAIRHKSLPADATCQTGGTLIEYGEDDGAGGGIAGDGDLQDGEVRGSTTICHGARGETGSQGSQGLQGPKGDKGDMGSAGADCWDDLPGGSSPSDCRDAIRDDVREDLLRIAAASSAIALCGEQGHRTGNTLDVGMVPMGSNGEIACDRIANGGQDWCCANVNVIYPDDSDDGLGHNEAALSFPCATNFTSGLRAYAFACCKRGASCL